MTKLLTSLTLAAALSTITIAASADPATNVTSVLPGPRVRVRIVAPRPVVRVAVPVVVVPGVRVRPVRVYQQRRRSAPLPGLSLLLGGAFTLGTGAFNVAYGVNRINNYGKDPFGIVSVSLGGTAMLVGLPLTIIGIVRYANEPPEVIAEENDEKDSDTSRIRFAPTADGFAIHF